MKKLLAVILSLLAFNAPAGITTSPTTSSSSIASAGGITNGFYNRIWDTNQFYLFANVELGQQVQEPSAGLFTWSATSRAGIAAYDCFDDHNVVAAYRGASKWVVTNYADQYEVYFTTNFPLGPWYVSPDSSGSISVPAIGAYGPSISSTSLVAMVALSPQIPTLGGFKLPQLGFEMDGSGFDATRDNATNCIAEAKSSGMYYAGYNYIVINGWLSASRDGSGNLQAGAPWPEGMPWFIYYAHTNGMLVSLQFQLNPPPVIQNQMHHDATNMVAWGADAFLIDGFNGPTPQGPMTVRSIFEQMRAELVQGGIEYGHNVYVSESFSTDFQDVQGSHFAPWIAAAGNSWVMGPDGSSLWSDLTNNVGLMLHSQSFSGPGHLYNMNSLQRYNDDTNNFKGAFIMRVIGPSATMRIGQKPSQLTAFEMNVVTNTEALAILRDPLVDVGRVVWTNGGAQVWVRDLIDGSKAVALWNPLGSTPAMTVNWADIGINSNQLCNVRDVIYRTNFTATGSFAFTMAANTAQLYHVIPYSAITPLAVGASPFFWTNNNPLKVMTYLSGTVTALTNNGVSIGTAVTSIILQPGDWVSYTYSVAPTQTFRIFQ